MSKTVVVVWLTLSIASVLLAAITWFQLSQKLTEAAKAAAVRIELEAIARLLVDVETAQRGFTITGDERFLESLKQAEVNLPIRFQKLVTLTRSDFGSDSTALHDVIELRAAAEVLLGEHHELIKLRRDQGFQAAAEVIGTGEIKRAMDRLRGQMAEIRWFHQDLISGDGDARSQLLRASLTSLIAGAFGIGAGVIAFIQAQISLVHQQRERELVEAKLKAQQSSREKTVFLANMSHEIRTPMNSILGFSELLEGEMVEPAHRQYLKSIRVSANSLLQLINDILDMSKIEAGMLELKTEPTDPREICGFITTLFADPASRKGIDLECQVADNLPKVLMLDRIRLRQVLVNLVGNAIKFTDKGKVTVHMRREKLERSSCVNLIIEVRDSGVGIPQAKLESIFKPFVQAGAHRDKETAGTGLGLSIVKRLIEMMGGTVEAESVMDQGTVFYLRIPRIPVSARLPFTETDEPAEDVDFDALKPSGILVVDDNQTNCQLVEGMLAESHHQLFIGENGKQAVEMAERLHPDIILMDLRMPIMDGRQACSAIRRISSMEMTPIIAVTASANLSEEGNSEVRFDGYIRKPFTEGVLFAELAQFLPRIDREKPSEVDESPPAPLLASEDRDASSETGAPWTEAPPELIVALRDAAETRWPSVRDSLAINECKAFAEQLTRLAAQHRCKPLQTYGVALAKCADRYDVVQLERRLNEFPELIEQLSTTPRA